MTIWFLGSSVSSKMFSTCSNKVSRFSWDHGTVGVSNKSCIWVTIGIAKTSKVVSISSITKTSNRVNSSPSSGMVGLGSKYSWLVYWDNSTVGITHQTIRVASIGMGIGQASIGQASIGQGQTMGTKMSSLGSSNLRSVIQGSSNGNSHNKYLELQIWGLAKRTKEKI